ncbi:hypothetical protein SESBI_42032 [Sesbania bispinosa]|nr:hypothetical protein SESBI_42032 [Sesbania bispinosa]
MAYNDTTGWAAMSCYSKVIATFPFLPSKHDDRHDLEQQGLCMMTVAARSSKVFASPSFRDHNKQ